MILIDFNQVFISNLLSQLAMSKNTQPDENLVRHMVLSTILFYKKKFSHEYGDIVFCCDDRNYWRKDYFKYYKSNRKKMREASKYDWNMIFDGLDKVRNELEDFFPYKLLRVERAEADDIIATMCKYFQENELIEKGLITEPQKVLILSGDKDFLQLQKYPNISQYSPKNKKFIYSDSPEDYLIEHVIKGDDGDGIPNVLSSDDTFFDADKRQTVMSKKRFEAILEQVKSDNFIDETVKRNWQRNKQMIDLTMIPEDVENNIVQNYKNLVKKDKSKLFKYFIDNKLKLLMESLPEF